MSQAESVASRPEVSFHTGFWPSVASLDAGEMRRVIKAVELFGENPAHPSLSFHVIHGDPHRRLHTFRATDDIRVLLAREGNVHVLFEAGRHDDIYEKAERSRFVVSRSTKSLSLVELPREDEGRERPASTRAPSRSPDGVGIFDHWGHSDLASAGFDTAEIELLRSCASEDELLGLPLPASSLERAIDLLELTPEQWREPSLTGVTEVAEERFRQAVLDFGAFSGISPLFTPEEVARLASAPIEDWMIFLHPDQRAIVGRHFEGPARVRGSAGTGKTVVALHRAVELGKRFEFEHDAGAPPVLFTTFIKSLSPVLESLYRRLPGARPDAVDFIHLDKLASAICREAGDRLVTSPRDVDAAWASAWKKVVPLGSPIAQKRLTRGYVRVEIASIIKGRGIGLEEYLTLERTGRRTSFGKSLREQVWELRLEWDRQMASRGVVDFPDVRLRALEHARARSAPMYRAAIVDEAQDLTLVGLQFVRTLVNGRQGIDRPDGLFISGDGAQRIYEGGFTLRQAGIETRGRTTVLRLNYRNTREIIESAMAVAGDESVDDLGEEYKRGDAEATAERIGMRPVLVACANADDELAFIAERINGLAESGAIGLGDIAVCAATNRIVDDVKRTLGAASIPHQDLSEYDGVPSDRVKVGTFFRAKGLEFKVVFLPGVSFGDFPRPKALGQDEVEYEDQRALSVSQLFVAMTRARDGLFLTCTQHPSDVLEPALDRFELIEL